MFIDHSSKVSIAIQTVTQQACCIQGSILILISDLSFDRFHCFRQLQLIVSSFYTNSSQNSWLKPTFFVRDNAERKAKATTDHLNQSFISIGFIFVNKNPFFQSDQIIFECNNNFCTKNIETNFESNIKKRKTIQISDIETFLIRTIFN